MNEALIALNDSELDMVAGGCGKKPPCYKPPRCGKKWGKKHHGRGHGGHRGGSGGDSVNFSGNVIIAGDDVNISIDQD